MFYVETSAAAKLVRSERGSTPLRRWLASRDDRLFSSDLLRTELLRLARRADPGLVVQARTVLGGFTLLELSTSVCERAATLGHSTVRSLDALHLAAAMELGDELEGIITYDERLADGAKAVGIPVVAPG